MTQLAIAVAALVALGFAVVFLMNYLNRRMRRIGRHAAGTLQRRFTQRQSLPVDSILVGAGVPGRLRARAKKFVERLARAIGVSPGLIRPEDTLRDLVVVRKDELGPEYQKEWDEAGLDERVGDVLYIFSEDVFKVLMKTYRRPEWQALWAQLPHARRPASEGDWLAFIIDMSVKDLIDVFEKQA